MSERVLQVRFVDGGDVRLDASAMTFAGNEILFWNEAGEQLASLASSRVGSVEVVSPSTSARSTDPRRGSSEYIDEVREMHSSAYARWTAASDELLTQGYRNGETIEQLAARFGRQPSAITSRLKKLAFEREHDGN